MPLSKGLKNSLNRIRELSSEIYHQYIPILEDDTDISAFATPLLTRPELMNEFIPQLIQRIVYTQIEVKQFNNPLRELEGMAMPLGYIGQEIYINPAKGRQFNINDFAGLLQKYESDVKVQYMSVNMDTQYPVTITRAKLKGAFVSWEDLDEFVSGITQSLYNGAYIDEFRFTKWLVSSAYNGNNVVIEEITAPTTPELAKQFITRVRELYLNFRFPSDENNAWKKVGGYGHPVITWSDPDDIVFLIRNDLISYIDVEVLASAFNLDKTTLLGKIYPIDNFNVYNTEDGSLLFDGSKILGMIADKRWFRIKEQDRYMDEFYNANNRTWQIYLNVTKMYQYSLFSNAVVFASELPSVTITGLDYNNTPEINVPVNTSEGLDINVTPFNANTPNIAYQVDNADYVELTVDPNNNRHVTIMGKAQGEATLTATAGNVTTTIKINVTEGV